MSFCISPNCFTSRLTSGRRGPRAGRDAASARAGEDRRVAALGRGHRPDDRLGPLEVAAVDGGLCFPGHVAHARDHRHDLADRPHLLDLLELVEHVLEGEARLAELLLHLLGLVDVEGLLRPFDERQDVAHPEDPAGQAVRVERLEGIGLLAGAEELDRQPGDRRDAERGAAAGVAVDLGQDRGR